MPSKRRGQGGDNQWADGDKKRSRPVRQKHLYLVLDDWSKGFTIHRIDTDSFYSDSGDRQDASLPEPPALRIESPVDTMAHTNMFFSPLGSKIFVLKDQHCALVYDTRTAALALGPHATPAQTPCGIGVTVPVGEMLYVLSYRFFDEQHSFEVMSREPARLDDPQRRPSEGCRWSWKTLPAPTPTFSPNQIVVSHAVHPDGRTIFMTTAYRGGPGLHVGTFSFNTESCAWRWHGEWALPFEGQGYFDADLDGWVGLGGDGHVCCSRVASGTRSLTRIMELDWQTTEEKLFCKNPETERHLSASLAYAGEGSRFCLVESVVQVQEGVDMTAAGSM